jgi:hypothetical protein
MRYAGCGSDTDVMSCVTHQPNTMVLPRHCDNCAEAAPYPSFVARAASNARDSDAMIQLCTSSGLCTYSFVVDDINRLAHANVVATEPRSTDNVYVTGQPPESVLVLKSEEDIGALSPLNAVGDVLVCVVGFMLMHEVLRRRGVWTALVASLIYVGLTIAIYLRGFLMW